MVLGTLSQVLAQILSVVHWSTPVTHRWFGLAGDIVAVIFSTMVQWAMDAAVVS
jgi:hypothetical protein